MYSSPLIDNDAWTVQKRDIERLVHAYLGDGTTITPRALRALQVGTYSWDTGVC